MIKKRRFIHIHGRQNWCIRITRQLLLNCGSLIDSIICCGFEDQSLVGLNTTYIDNSKKRSEIENHLGSEYSALIFNCFNGFNPDLFCALTGLIKSPGIIILITPDIQQWSVFADPEYSKLCSHPHTPENVKGRFVTYLVEKLTEKSKSRFFSIIGQNDQSESNFNSIKTDIYSLFIENTLASNKKIKPSLEQKTIATAIENLATAKADGIIIIYGHRGRGKSTTIGKALCNLALLSQISQLQVSVVSQNKKNVGPIYKQLSELNHNYSFNFFPPDEFLRNNITAGILVIDEAATIPLAVLKKLIISTGKIVISSTTDGYEGTGMGLSTKFQSFLSRSRRSIKQFELITPYRWANNDPVESFIFETFLMHSAAQNNDTKLLSLVPNLNNISIQKVDRDLLSKNTKKVFQLFQLLSQAHYRTTPSDLRYILDAPSVELWTADHDGEISAVLMLSNEGAINSTYEGDIWLGRRRLSGHLIPQTLSTHSGFKKAIRFAYKRIVRIAVIQKHQRHGIASKLLDRVYHSTLKENQELDFLGVSYGFESGLYQFWQTMGFNAVRIGHRENARSGLKSMIMLKPISKKAKIFSAKLENHFKQDYLFKSKRSRPAATSTNLSLNTDDIERSVKSDDQDKLDVYSFAYGNRQLSNCQRALHAFAIRCLNTDLTRSRINQKQISLITFKVLQDMDWEQCGTLLGLNGKQQILKQLRSVYALLYSVVWGNKS